MTVGNTNDVPTLGKSINDQSTTEGSIFSFTFPEGSFGDPDGDMLTYTAMLDDGSALPDWLAFTSSTRTFAGTSTSGDVGTLNIVVAAIDPSDESVTTEFVISVSDFDPVAVDDIDFTTNEDLALELVVSDLLLNDQYVDVDHERVIEFLAGIGVTELGAVLSVAADTGQISYQPLTSSEIQSLNVGQTVQDSFRYGIWDDRGVASFATVFLAVSGRNDAPHAVDDVIAVSSVTKTEIDPFINDEDVDGNIVRSTMSVTVEPQFGELLFEDGQLSYLPGASFVSEDGFTYTIADHSGELSRVATVRLLARPLADTIVAGTSIERSVEVAVAPYFASQTPLDLSLVEILSGPVPGTNPIEQYGPSHGSAEVINGALVYMPSPGYTGSDSLYFTVVDQDGSRSLPTLMTIQTVQSRLQYPLDPADVNRDGQVSALDALLVINRLNRLGTGSVEIVVDQEHDYGIGTNDGVDEQYFYDVNGDVKISALDALLAINRLVEQPAESERVPSGEWIGSPLVSAENDPISGNTHPTTIDERQGETKRKSGGDSTANVFNPIDLIAMDRHRVGDTDAADDDVSLLAALDAAIQERFEVRVG
ncbi:Dockerin type I repeat protein [Planctomycetes bacterium CA13]|uniref:Dockerin type I repeat protein n=1 Tax=Novipirellula herctigrandis TaxID=2527986 RepID=A0A5C5ZA75_9BACT|nr:Dockerin type I repeat protein [Planctomycetes bacterium CA13]